MLDDARAKLLALFAFDAMPLGAAVFASEIYATLQSATGVVAVDIDVFQLKHYQDLTAIERAVRAVDARPLQPHIRIFPARPTPPLALIDRFAQAGFEGTPPPVLAAEQAFIEDAGERHRPDSGGGALTWPSPTPSATASTSLLPAFIRERDQQSGEGLRGAPRRRRPASRCHRGGYPAAPGERLHRNLRAVGRRLYRRPRRHHAALRRKPGQGRRHGDRTLPRSRRRRGSADQGAAWPRRPVIAGPRACGPSWRCVRAPMWRRPSTTGGARARCRCSRSWRAT